MSLVIRNTTAETQYVQGLIIEVGQERDVVADLTLSELLDAYVEPLGKGLAAAILAGDFLVVAQTPVVKTLDFIDAGAPQLIETSTDRALVAGCGYVIPSYVSSPLKLDLPDPNIGAPGTRPIVVVNLSPEAATLDAGAVDILPVALPTVSVEAGVTATFRCASIGSDLVYVRS